MHVAHIHAHKHIKTLKTLKTLKVAWVNRQGHFTVVFQNKNNDIYICIYMCLFGGKRPDSGLPINLVLIKTF